MCDLSDIKLAEVKMNEAMRDNNFNEAVAAWDRLTELRREYAAEHHFPKSTN